MKCYIIDTFNYSYSHEMFNAGLLNTCRQLFNDIRYFACKSSIGCLKDIINEKDLQAVRFRKVFVVGGKSKYSLMCRYIFSAISNVLLILNVPKDVIIIFNQNNIFSTKLINNLNKLLNKKIIIICHGELELLKNNLAYKPGLLGSMIRNLVKSFFLNEHIVLAANIYFIVLGDILLLNLQGIVSKTIADRFYCIDLPYVFNDIKTVNNNQKKINLGTVGEVEKNKNIKNIIYLAKIFQKEIQNDTLSLSIIGKVLVNKDELLKAHIDISNNNLNRDEFNKKIENLDYILFFYDKDNYRYTASGAVFDAINLEKPILSFKNDYFCYLFNKYGNFGYLVDSIEEMATYMRKILLEGNKTKFNFGKIKSDLSDTVISLQLRKILQTVQYDKA